MDDPSKLLTYIVPGYLAYWCYTALRPNKRRSDLELTLWAILWSSLLTLVSGYLYRPLSWLIHSFGVPYIGQESLGRVLVASFLGLLFGGLVGVILRGLGKTKWFLDLLGWVATNWGVNVISSFKESRVWNQVMERPAGMAWALVTLISGTRYVGQVEQYTLDPNVDQLELHLRTYSEVIVDSEGVENVRPVEGFKDLWIPASQIMTVQFFDDIAQVQLGVPQVEPASPQMHDVAQSESGLQPLGDAV